MDFNHASLFIDQLLIIELLATLVLWFPKQSQILSLECLFHKHAVQPKKARVKKKRKWVVWVLGGSSDGGSGGRGDGGGAGQ